LLQDRGAATEAQDSRNWTALHRAANCGNKAIVRLLLDYGTNIEAQDMNESTALHSASGGGHKATVQLLLDREWEGMTDCR
jgi:ankyrin repeat protein